MTKICYSKPWEIVHREYNEATQLDLPDMYKTVRQSDCVRLLTSVSVEGSGFPARSPSSGARSRSAVGSSASPSSSFSALLSPSCAFSSCDVSAAARHGDVSRRWLQEDELRSDSCQSGESPVDS